MTANPVKVVLLIDEQSLTQPLFSITDLLECIRQILLFYCSMTKNVLWSFRFFSTITRYSNTSMRHFEILSEESLETLEREYGMLNISQSKSGTPFAHIVQAMKDAIGDFHWDAESFIPSQNYMFILTPCPSTMVGLENFFDMATDEVMDKRLDDLTKELASSHVNVYKNHRISASIIDTTTSLNLSKTEFTFQGYMREALLSLLKSFNGNYIKAQKFMNYDSDFGNSLVSHSANFLPVKPNYQPILPVPTWKGIFTSADNTSHGNFILYQGIRTDVYDPKALETIGKIRIAEFLHISQFSPLWLSNQETCTSYTLSPDSRNTKNQYFSDLMGMLNAKRSVLTVELVPLAGFEDDKQMAIMEPLSSSTASLRLLDKSFTTAGAFWKPMDVPKRDPYYPIGGGNLFADLMKTSLQEKLPKDGPAEAPKFVSCLPDFLKKKVEEEPAQTSKRKADVLESQDEEEVEEKIIELPPNVLAFGMQFKKLYDEALYYRKEKLEDFITIVDKFVEHLISLKTSSIQIIKIFEKYALTPDELDIKHKEQVAKADLVPYGSGTTEQDYQSDWWGLLKENKKYDKEYVEMSLISLRLREAQLQVILHTFICKLLKDNPTVHVTFDANEAAQAFFAKMVLIFSCYNIENFLLELDAEDDLPADMRDPCDLIDKTFAYVLEDKFNNCLPELVTQFKEAAGDDDLMSIPDDDEEDLLALEYIAEEKENSMPVKKIPPEIKQPPPSLSTLLTVEPKRTFANPLDSLMKRTIVMSSANVDTSTRGRMGEAAQAAQSKIDRTMVNGKPTMKRAGSFITSAKSPKRRHIAHKEGPVTLRRKDVIDPKATPRTSLNRILNANIFAANYLEVCMSPNKDNPPTAQLLPSAYPKTPQGTSSRFRKTMLEASPLRYDDDEVVNFKPINKLWDEQSEEGDESPIPIIPLPTQKKYTIIELFSEDEGD